MVLVSTARMCCQERSSTPRRSSRSTQLWGMPHLILPQPLASVLLLPSLAAPFGEGGRWVAFVVRDALVDGAMCDSPDSCDEFDEPLEAPSDEVRGPGLAVEPAVLLDAEGLVELCGPVLSAWATPEPLARAAPTPSVIAPAPSQP